MSQYDLDRTMNQGSISVWTPNAWQNLSTSYYDGDAWYGTNFIGPGPDDVNPYKIPDPRNEGAFYNQKTQLI